MLAIQLLALSMVLYYYHSENATHIFTTIGQWKVQGGLLASALCTIISGGIFPEIVKRMLRDPHTPRATPGELAHQFTMWAIIGILVDLFYRFQAMQFGTGTQVQTLLTKVLVDQVVFTPFISLPFIVCWFLLREVEYDLRMLFRKLSIGLLFHRVLPLWINCLSFWPLFLLIVYSLPSDLQFPLFLFGNATYSMLLVYIALQQAAWQDPQTADH